jgi:hypothetical protein
VGLSAGDSAASRWRNRSGTTTSRARRLLLLTTFPKRAAHDFAPASVANRPRWSVPVIAKLVTEVAVSSLLIMT